MANVNGISRRDMLKGLGIGVTGFGLLSLGLKPAQAQDSMMPEILATYSTMFGDYKLTVITDTTLTQNAGLFGANAEEGAVADYFQSKLYAAEDGSFPGIVDILVLEKDGEVTVFDSGLGGRLVPSLAALGIAAEDVTRVIISHFHPDHVNGLSNEGVMTFPNAMVHFTQPEYDFMQANPDNGTAQGAMAKLQPYLDADMVAFYSDGDTLIEGVTAMAAHGHTPGHMAFMIESGGQRMMNIVDTTINAYAGLEHPEWYLQFDAAKDEAVETRIRVLGMASDERIPLFGYHFPFPGIGYAQRQGDADAWTWIPAAF